jgi:archaetidylinositol phosphate synthase
MIDDPFRAVLPKFVRPLIFLYGKLGLTPNHVTCLGLALSFGAATMVGTGMFLPAIAVWWLGRLFDGTDGIYARATNQTSALGAHFDILADMASYSFMVIGFGIAFKELSLYWLIVLFFYVLCITGALSLGALEEKKSLPGGGNRGLRLAAGIAEGGETGITYTVFLLFPGYLGALVPVWIGILLITVVARLLLAKRELSS